MFTGIIQAVGHVQAVTSEGADLRLRIATGKLDLAEARLGDSIAVSGVCLTMTALHQDGFSADVSAETLRCTTFGALREGSEVNLERALTLATPLGGHLVSGHVDGVATLRARGEVGQSLRCVFEVPASLAKYLAAKGAVCVDGVSLTVNAVQGASFEVNLVPHTLQVTTLDGLTPGSRVNLEVDLVARYVERLLAGEWDAPRGGVTRELLARQGYINE